MHLYIKSNVHGTQYGTNARLIQFYILNNAQVKESQLFQYGTSAILSLMYQIPKM